ncbi:EamA family transporter RarD [Steroidobacter sp.]|uniref:EamA family transporter RarD n=1 Tax=Steroidobacter sp. TaxID=1978227 RepID=UPI001A49A7FC|nr:EamA family transporter RarD [Steroidobacter sp.]MBL8268347.1 EamA family transporter RarD [Steroidobacter sp.]
MNDATAQGVDGRGLAAGVSAFLLWGLMPLYMKLLQSVPVLQITAHRMMWGCLCGFGWLALRGETNHVWRALADPQTRWRLCASAAFIAINWSIFMWGIATHHVVEISLGYFIGPLVNVALGVVLFRERLKPLQWLSVAIATAGVLYLTWTMGRPPWVSLALALSFSSYGLVRKVAKVEALPGFTGETLLLLPFAAVYLLWAELSGVGTVTTAGLGIDALLLFGGPLTAVPLVLFAVGARRIPLFTLGLLQYIAPTMQLACAVLLFGEPFGGSRVIGFFFIWAALAVFVLDGLLTLRRRAF